MEKMIIALAVIAIAAIVMLIKWPGAALGYLYCVGVGLAMALRFLYPFTSETYEVLHCLTLGGGVGAVFGLAFAAALRGSEYNIGVILGGILLLPILMFVVGFIQRSRNSSYGMKHLRRAMMLSKPIRCWRKKVSHY